jgi:hypothetical protein
MSMRKALIGLILAATAITPIAAEAQRGHRDGGRGSSSRQSGGSGESRAARIEQRNEARQTNNDAPPQQAQPQPQPQQQVAQRPRGGDGGGNRGGNRGGDNGGNRNWRGNDNDGQNNQGNRGGWNRGDRGGDGDRRGRNSQPGVSSQGWQGNANDPRLERRSQDRNWRNQQGDRRGNDGRNWRDNRGDRDTRRGDRRRGDWNRGWRNDRRYDWNGWRRGNRHIFRVSPYYSPYRNWRYSRFSIGLFLEPLFYNQNYWIGDPWQYRLPPAAYGTQWVRYYNDVLLVDIYTGEVLDVIYDFFW